MNYLYSNMLTIKESLNKLIRMNESIIETNVLTENVDIAGYLIDANIQLILIINEKNEKNFYKRLKDFIINNKGCYYIALILLSFPKEYACNLIQFNPDFECAYTINYTKYFDNVSKVINSQYQFLFEFNNGVPEDVKEVTDYWRNSHLFDNNIGVFFTIQNEGDWENERNPEISLQILKNEGFTFDVHDIIQKSDIRNFLGDILKENRFLKDDINIRMKYYISQKFTFL